MTTGDTAAILSMLDHLDVKLDGVHITPTGPFSSYRPLWKQREFHAAYRAGRGPLAAVPGTSIGQGGR